MSQTRIDPNGMVVRHARGMPLLGLAISLVTGLGARYGGGDTASTFLAWIVCVITALGGVSMLLGIGIHLKMDRGGFTVKGWFRSRRYRWRDVGYFRTTRVEPSRLPAHMAVKFEGREASSSYDAWTFHVLSNYAIKADKLAGIMNAYRERAAGPPGD